MIKEFFDKIKDRISTSRTYALGISGAAFILIALFSFTSAYELFELKLYDLRFRLKPSTTQWDMLTFLNIDDNSIANVGQFPWPRFHYARGIDVMRETGVKQFTFDIQFIDRSPAIVDTGELVKLREAAAKRRPVSPEDVANVVLDSDAMLAGAMKAMGKVIIPYSFLKEELVRYYPDAATKQETEKGIKLFIERASLPVPSDKKELFKTLIDPDRLDMQYPIPPLVETAHDFGFVDSDFDVDGTTRKIRLVRVFKDRIYFHMGLVMMMDLCGVPRKNVEILPGKKLVLKDALNPVTMTKETIEIPIDKKGIMYINWAGDLEKTFNHLSFYALFEYPNVRDEVHGYFDQEEIRSGKTTRSTLYGELAAHYEKFKAAKEPDVKRVAWHKVVQARKKIRDIEAGYAKALSDEIKKLTAEQGKKKDPETQKTLDNLKNFMTAIKIVTEVEKLADHSVITGLTGTATQDIGVTPTSSEFMMVGTYPNIVNTILQKSFIRKVNPLVDLGIMLAVALLIGLIIQKLSAMRSVLTLAASFILVNAAVTALFTFFNLWLDQLGITLALLLPAITIASIKFISEESQKRFIKSAFSHYLSPKVIDEIIDDPDSLKLGGEKRTISLFFSDVQGFSTISEKLTPEELVRLLNEYLSEMTDIILKYEGTVDKFEGDAIMAFFGAPRTYDDHAVKVCMAALDMKQRLAEMREVWKNIGQHELKARMGMNTGDAVVGNMGSRTRMDYTAMGDSVNLASRLEGANKAYGTYAMISQSTYEAAKDHIEARQLDFIRVVGKEEPILVYELIQRKGRMKDQMQAMIEKYNQGLELFRNREWTQARNMFRSALKIISDDGPSKTYYGRCTEFMKSPPPRNWDGVYRLKSK